MPIGLLCLLLISFSFVLSSSEIAIFSLSRVQLKKIKDQSEPIFRKIRILIQDSLGLLITVLFFNEIVNIALGAIITSQVVEPLDLNFKLQTFLGVMISTPIILICCELTPKVVATRANQLVISIFLPVVYFLYRVMKPFLYFIQLFMPAKQLRELHQLHEEDFIILAEEQTETGHLHETELELIKNVFEMDDMRVDQLATSMKKLITIPANYTLEQASQTLMRDKLYSRVPISGKYKEDIVGVLNTKDLVELKLNAAMKTENVMTIAKEPLIVSSSLTTEALFRKMKGKKIQVAFIKNQQGKITGMVTLQDILDVLIEEAFEE